MSNLFNLLLLLPLLFIVRLASAAPVKVLYDVEPHGPEGHLDQLQRWRDTIGTATQVWSLGRAPHLTAIRTMRSGPLSAVYLDTISSSTASNTCETRGGEKCEVAIDGFGTVGEVHYVFNSSRTNKSGRSTQVLVACRCLSDECEKAVLMRPVNVFKLAPDGSRVAPGNPTCLYEAVGDKFSECHAELLRVSYREKHVPPSYARNLFNYSVTDSDGQEFWNATGQRGWTRDCEDREVAALPSVKLAEIVNRGLRFHKHKTPATSKCRPPPGVQYYRTDDADAETCREVYDYAAAAGAHIATQQDEIATGNLPTSYQDPPPPLLDDTELALICSAAGLGVLFVWSRFRKKLKPEDNSVRNLLLSVTGQGLFLYILEALPLHTALGGELQARDWLSLFAFADASLMLAKDQNESQGTAYGSVIVLVTVLGEIEYKHTREVLIASLTALFDIISVGIILMTIIRKVGFIRSERRRLCNGVDNDTDTSSDRSADLFLKSKKGWWRRIKSQRWRRKVRASRSPVWMGDTKITSGDLYTDSSKGGSGESKDYANLNTKTSIFSNVTDGSGDHDGALQEERDEDFVDCEWTAGLGIAGQVQGGVGAADGHDQGDAATVDALGESDERRSAELGVCGSAQVPGKDYVP